MEQQVQNGISLTDQFEILRKELEDEVALYGFIDERVLCISRKLDQIHMEIERNKRRNKPYKSL